MLTIALELAAENPAYADMASKFFEHYVEIADAMNSSSMKGLWNEEDGFYYDHLYDSGNAIPLKVRSMVGIIPLFTVTMIDDSVLQRLPGKPAVQIVGEHLDGAPFPSVVDTGTMGRDQNVPALP